MVTQSSGAFTFGDANLREKDCATVSQLTIIIISESLWLYIGLFLHIWKKQEIKRQWAQHISNSDDNLLFFRYISQLIIIFQTSPIPKIIS